MALSGWPERPPRRAQGRRDWLPPRSCCACDLLFNLEHCEKRLLRYLHRPDLLHSFLSFFLLLQQLALACDVAAVALRGNVLAQWANRLARNDLGSDRCLDHYLE